MYDDLKAAARLLVVAVCLAVVCFIIPSSLRSQEITASISGTVTDPSGAVIPKATVTLHNDGTGADRTVQTDGSGVYHATLLTVGNYTLTVAADRNSSPSKAGFL